MPNVCFEKAREGLQRLGHLAPPAVQLRPVRVGGGKVGGRSKGLARPPRLMPGVSQRKARSVVN